MHLSHSGLQQMLQCPASYYLNKHAKISLKEEKSALSIGSAFHWGCEHDTDDLNGYIESLDHYVQFYNDFDRDFAIATGMAHGYQKFKKYLLDQILSPYEGGGRLEIIKDFHELDLTVELPSIRYEKPHEFHGIIDWLIYTERGWIVLDYKTSTTRPDFTKYLDQVLRYCWMLRTAFPDVPIYKVGIINVKKVSLRQKTGEARDNFIIRIKREYECNDNGQIEYYEFSPEDFSEDKMNPYIENLSRMCDFAQNIEDNNFWFINFGNAVTQYGKSEYWDIFYKTRDAYLKYKIEDEMWNDEMNCVTHYRDCLPIDLHALENRNLMNSFIKFEETWNEHPEMPADIFRTWITQHFSYCDELLDKYFAEHERRLRDAENEHSVPVA